MAEAYLLLMVRTAVNATRYIISPLPSTDALSTSDQISLKSHQ